MKQEKGTKEKIDTLFSLEEEDYRAEIEEKLLGKERLNWGDVTEFFREKCKKDLYFLSKYVLRHRKLTIGLHRPICRLVQEHAYDDFMLIYPGDHFKTTIAKSLAIWWLIRDANERILLVNAVSDNVQRFLREIKQHFESNEVFRWLFPELVPKDFRKKTPWNEEQMLVVRDEIKPEPSISTIGVGGTLTSQHYTRISCTDLVEREIAKSETKLRNTLDWWPYLYRVIDKPGSIFYEGNRWAVDDVIGWVIENDCKEYHDISRGVERKGKGRFYIVKRSAVENGVPIFPERYTMEFFNWLMDVAYDVYCCQYQNEPREVEGRDFKKEWLSFYKRKKDGPYDMEGKRVCYWEDIIYYLLIDPGISKKKGSARTGMVVLGDLPTGNFLITEAYAAKLDGLELIEKAFELIKEYRPRKIGIEAVGYQYSLKAFFEDKAKRERIPVQVEAIYPHGQAKEARILGLQPYFASGRIHILDDLNEFKYEYLGFSKDEDRTKSVKTRDLLDALAYFPELCDNRRRGIYMWEKWEEERQRRRETADSVTGY